VLRAVAYVRLLDHIRRSLAHISPGVVSDGDLSEASLIVLISETYQMTLRIAVSNQKGGAGKTTTAINVAGALAHRGHDVLLVDLDPQGHSTEALDLDDQYEIDAPSMFDALVNIEQRDIIDSLICHREEFDVVPSHVDMFRAEAQLTTERRREERLQMVLGEMEGEYDFLLVDCPPNLGVLTDNALLATGNVLIPAQPRTSSVRALEILFDQIEALEETYDVEIRQVALVANETRNDSETEEMLEWFRDVFGGDGVYEIPTRVALQRAWNAGVSIFEHEESLPEVEAEYERLAAALEEIADE